MKLTLYLTLFFVLLTFAGIAQSIKIKKKVVYIDGKECLNVEGGGLTDNSFSLFDLDDNEIVFLQYIRDEISNDIKYAKIVFPEQKASLTNSVITTKKLLIKRLLSSRTLKDCKLNAEKVETFALKYDQKLDKKETDIVILFTM